MARRPEPLERVRADVEALGARTVAVAADVGRPEDVERVAAAAFTAFDRVDVLVNNASELGPTPMPYLLDTDPDALRRVLEVNLVGPFLLTRALLGPMLAAGQGSVINVSSDAGVVGYPGWGAYGVSKAGLDQMTRIWASELDGSGVHVNTVDPGDMAIDMHAAALPDDDPATLARPEDRTEVFVRLAAADGESGRRLEAAEYAPTQARGRRCAARSGSAPAGARGGGAARGQGPASRPRPAAAGRPGHRVGGPPPLPRAALAAGAGRPAGRERLPHPAGQPAGAHRRRGAARGPAGRARRRGRRRPGRGRDAAKPGGGRHGTGEAEAGTGERWAALVLGVPADGTDPALVATDARPPVPPVAAGERIVFAGGLAATVLGRHEEAALLVWVAFDLAGERLAEALHRRAAGAVRLCAEAWPPAPLQTLFAAGPGSAEMASVGRPFTADAADPARPGDRAGHHQPARRAVHLRRSGHRPPLHPGRALPDPGGDRGRGHRQPRRRRARSPSAPPWSERSRPPPPGPGSSGLGRGESAAYWTRVPAGGGGRTSHRAA